jgi:hypothetical protein
MAREPSPEYVIAADRHRNGISGDTFYVGIILDTNTLEDGSEVEVKRLVVYFPQGDCSVAVLNVEDIAKGNIWMFPDSSRPGTGFAAFRGDHFLLWAELIKSLVKV